MIEIPSFQESGLVVCSETDENLNASRFCHQSQKNKTTSDSSTKLIEKFTELTIENSNVKSPVEGVDKSSPETKAVDCSEKCVNQKVLSFDSRCATNDSCEQLPVAAKISIKEKGRETVCLTCNEEISCHRKQELNKIESINKKNLNLSLTQLLISRSPIRNGRKHCKEGNGHNSSVGLSPSQQRLYGSETNSHTSLYANDTDFYVEALATPPESYTDSVCDQLSPISHDYSSSSIANDVELRTGYTEISLPSISELYPTPPHSAFENTLPFPNDILSHSNDYVNDSLSGSSWPISQLSEDYDPLKSQCLEEIFTTNVSSLSKKSELNVLSPTSHSQGKKLEQIYWYLKNGDVDPIIAQAVTDYSESLSKTNNANFSEYNNSATANGQSIKELYAVQQLSSNNEQTKQQLVATELPSSTSFQTSTSVVSTYNVSNTEHQLQSSENNVTSSTILLRMPIPIPLQTITISGLRDTKYQRELKPKPCSSSNNEVALCKNIERELKHINYNRLQVISETSQTNSVCQEKYKSVKQKIGASILFEQKKQLLKEQSLEEKSTMESETKLHSAVLNGDEKLVYVIIESRRTKIRTDLISRTDSTPRISAKEEIKRFVNVQNIHGCTPLYYAALGNNDLLTAYLLECGADPYIKDNRDGNTPFHIATIKGDGALQLTKLLSFHRNISDISKIQNNKGQTVLISAVINHGKKYNKIQRNGIKLIRYLLKENHKLSLQDVEGRTALHIAVLKKDLELLEVLLTYATDGNSKFVLDYEGNSILHLAALLTDIEVETHCKLICMIILHCSKLTEIKNNKGKVPYELINENRKQERELLKMKMDEYGFRNL